MINITSENEDGIIGTLKHVHEKVTHALGIIDATFELMPRVYIRNPADNHPFSTVRMGRAPGRFMVVGGRRKTMEEAHGWKEQTVERKDDRSRIGDVGIGFAGGTTDRLVLCGSCKGVYQAEQSTSISNG